MCNYTCSCSWDGEADRQKNVVQYDPTLTATYSYINWRQPSRKRLTSPIFLTVSLVSVQHDIIYNRDHEKLTKVCQIAKKMDDAFGGYYIAHIFSCRKCFSKVGQFSLLFFKSDCFSKVGQFSLLFFKSDYYLTLLLFHTLSKNYPHTKKANFRSRWYFSLMQYTDKWKKNTKKQKANTVKFCITANRE